MDGNYYINESGLEELKENDQIVFRYCSKKGSPMMNQIQMVPFTILLALLTRIRMSWV